MPAKLELLIVTQPSRREFLSQLLAMLEPQIIKLGLRKSEQVDILISADELALPIGDRRELLRRKAAGDYICFLDDDDLVAPNYVSRILPLLDGVDQVGFEVKAWQNKNPLPPTYHSLEHKNWWNYHDRLLRDISHLNPMRRELALEKPMSGGIGEDFRWSQAMRGLVKTEHYIPEVMYYYLSRHQKNDALDPFDPWRLEIIEGLTADCSPRTASAPASPAR